MATTKLGETTVLQIHRGGGWTDAATVQAFGQARCRFEYLPEYVFGEEAPPPVALGLPLTMAPDEWIEGPTGRETDRRVPAFLYDMVPQGKGRQFLLDRLQLPDEEGLVMPLVMAGAFNPIGCLRLQSAVSFFQEQARLNPDPATADGFALEQVLARNHEFLEHLSLHAMLASGTTGVQGVAPKFLLTTDADGRWFADMALPDELAREHWLVKLPRGRSDDDRAVLRNEAGYLRLASACGLRVHSEPVLRGEVLFVRRFDRQVMGESLHRLHQESMASVCGLRGFGVVRSQQALLAGLRSVVTDPLAETIEFMKRDVLNLAMRNTDNHARNTAVQRLVDGTVQLTPVFDFAPMYKDPEFIVRHWHWRDAAGVRQDSWKQVIEELDVSDKERAQIAAAMADFASTAANLPVLAQACGIEADVIDACRAAIDIQAEQLAALSDLAPARKAARPKKRQGGIHG